MYLFVDVELETGSRFVAEVADLPPSLLPLHFRAAKCARASRMSERPCTKVRRALAAPIRVG